MPGSVATRMKDGEQDEERLNKGDIIHLTAAYQAYSMLIRTLHLYIVTFLVLYRFHHAQGTFLDHDGLGCGSRVLVVVR